MTITVKPIHQNGLADDPALAAAGYTVPSEFNAGSVIEMATARLLGRVTALAGAAEELTAAQVRTLLALVIGTDVQAYDVDTAKTDVAQNFTATQRAAPVALASAASLAFTLAGGNSRTLTLGTNATLPNPSDIATYVGMKGSIACQQDTTGGRTLSFGNLWFPIGAAAAPSAPTAASAKFRIDYEVVSSTRIDFQLSKVGTA